MDVLPSEIILYITTFLSPYEVVKLQLVSHRLFLITRDNKLWRTQCFESSSWESLRRRRELIASAPGQQPLLRDLQRALRTGDPTESLGVPKIDTQNFRAKANERIRILANWDPSYPDEKINWYSEFIHRTAPISISWLQLPRNRDSNEGEPMEVRGVAIYSPPNDDHRSMVVGPLDDGSICLWDVSGPSEQQGKIVGRSTSNVLRISGSSSGALRSRMINTGVTECVSINNFSSKAYIAVQSELVEIDLESLKVISQEKFPFSIAAISDAKYTTPITVGTNLSLHLHDPREKHFYASSSDAQERLEDIHLPKRNSFQVLYNPQPINYAPLFHPGPCSIIHIPTSEDNWDGNGEIYVAGRFPSILNYDRRCFPKLRGTIHSGARLCSMTSIPYPFAAQLKDSMRRAELPMEQVQAAKEMLGNTLIACGEYNSKGSLELYGLSPLPEFSTISSNSSAGKAQNSDFLKNRQTSSNSKLLSVSNHGTRIVFSDGGGNIKWVERDGFTEVRDWNIGHGSIEGPRGIFGTLGDSYMGSGSGDIVRKILHTHSHGEQSQTSVDKDNLVIWTGERVGLLTFLSKPSFTADSFEEKIKSVEDTMREKEEKVYGQTMRMALQRQADEVRFVGGLGLGLG